MGERFRTKNNLNRQLLRFLRAIVVIDDFCEVGHISMSSRSFTEEQGRIFKHARIAAGKTQQETGAVAGKSAATVRRWENGDGSPTWSQLYAIARFFRMPVRKLQYGGEEGDFLDLSDLPDEIRELVRVHVEGLIRWSRAQQTK